MSCSQEPSGARSRARRPQAGYSGALCALGLAVAVGLGAGTPAQAAFPGTNGTIACGGVRGSGTDTEIFQVDPDGTGERVLTDNDIRDGSPAYSPDGTKIAFESQRHNVPGEPANTEIYVADNDGDLEGPDVKRLTFNDGTLTGGTKNGVAATDFSPSWSPDGTEIVFHSGRETTFTDGGTSPARDFEIYKMSATTGESITPATRLTNKRGQDAIPSWSPDGTKIAFQGFPAGNDSAQFPVNLEVFTMNPDGSGLTNVSNSTGTPDNPGTLVNENADGLDRDIIWSPDGRQIAYSSTRGSTEVGNQNFDVWRANRDGSNPVRLTSGPDDPLGANKADFDVPLVWSPDGSRLLFASSRESTPVESNFFAYTMNPATGDTGPASVRRVARVTQFQRCDWRALAPAVAPPPPPPPVVVPPPPVVVTPPAQVFAAKLSLARARLLRGERMLDVLAPITSLASGDAKVELHAAGMRTRFSVPVSSVDARIRFKKAIPAAQARLGTGIVTLTYEGDADTRPQTVRLRAAAGKANLRLARPTIVGGRLRAAGTISDDARGVVRVQIQYESDGQTRTLRFLAPIRGGKWSVDEKLDQNVVDGIARRTGTVHSYTLFTGYMPRRMRGEMRSYQVLGAR